MASSRLWRTSRVMTSATRRAIAHLIGRDDEVAEVVRGELLAGTHDDRRGGQLDDHRARELESGRERLAVEYRRGGPAAVLSEEQVARPLLRAGAVARRRRGRPD